MIDRKLKLNCVLEEFSSFCERNQRTVILMKIFRQFLVLHPGSESCENPIDFDLTVIEHQLSFKKLYVLLAKKN